MLDSSVDGEVIDFDAALCQEFFDVAVGQSVSEIPADSQQDDFGWEPITSERGTIDTRWLIPLMVHLGSLAR